MSGCWLTEWPQWRMAYTLALTVVTSTVSRGVYSAQSYRRSPMVRRADERRSSVNYEALRAYTPYIASWSEERDVPTSVIERPGLGIGYADEAVWDRDRHGVLWVRALSRPGLGEPLFAKVHPLRQRQAMRRLLCNVCAKPADRAEEGVLWLLKDHRDDWLDWPEDMAVTEPPVCLPCVRLSSRLCPALRPGAVGVRARYAPVSGVYGTLYRSGGLLPVPMDDITVALDDPRIRWMKVSKLVRELHDCTLVEVDELCRS
jgi:hypothetical protein